MLSLDTRLVVDGSAVSMSVPPTSYSPVTPTDLTRAFEYDVGLSPVVAMHESGIKHEARSSSCEEDASLGEFDFGHDLPALSVGDSCSPATSPASSWIDDAHSAATPDPPAFDLVATTGSWDDQLSAGFAAPLDVSFFWFLRRPLASLVSALLPDRISACIQPSLYALTLGVCAIEGSPSVVGN